MPWPRSAPRSKACWTSPSASPSSAASPCCRGTNASTTKWSPCPRQTCALPRKHTTSAHPLTLAGPAPSLPHNSEEPEQQDDGDDDDDDESSATSDGDNAASSAGNGIVVRDLNSAASGTPSGTRRSSRDSSGAQKSSKQGSQRQQQSKAPSASSASALPVVQEDEDGDEDQAVTTEGLQSTKVGSPSNRDKSGASRYVLRWAYNTTPVTCCSLCRTRNEQLSSSPHGDLQCSTGGR